METPAFSFRIPLFLACALFALTSPAARTAEAPSATDAELARYADQLFSQAFPPGEPGAAVLIAKDGQVLLRKGYGLANLELGVPMPPDAVFELASVTKQFTAAAILLLQERGKLSVQDDVQKYLPDFPTRGHKITLDQLLTHRSGVTELTALPAWWPRHREDMTVEQILDLFKDKPLDFTPGEKVAYSNSGYILLGAVVEKASGKSYEDFVEGEIFAPLGMKRSRYGHETEVVPGRAAGYDRTPDGYKVAEYLSLTQAYAAGGLLSTVDDLALWADALASRKLLKPASWERMTTPVKLPSGETTKAAYGLQVSEEDGARILEHGGGLPGFNTHLLIVPDRHLVVIVLANRFGGEASLESMTYRVTMKALGKAVEERRAVKLDAATLDQYVGVFSFGKALSRTVFRQGDRLFTRRTDGDPHEILAASRDDFFYADSDNRLHFRRDEQGKVVAMDVRYRFGPMDETGLAGK
jgi:CubicO group peptidase (beta-lactamase class C family)